MSQTMPTHRRGLTALVVAALAAVMCAPAQARPLQVREGHYQGEISGPEAFANSVTLTVSAGGSDVQGVIDYVVDSSVDFEGRTTLLCLRFEVDWSAAPIKVNGSGASGTAAVEQSAADGACSQASVFEGAQVNTADVSLVFNDTVATGKLTVPGDPPLVLELRADRKGSETTTASGPAVPGIEEFIDGVALTEETAARLKAIEACTEIETLPGERCDQNTLARAASPFRDRAETILGEGVMDDDVNLRRLAFIGASRDPNGKLVCPSLAPMFRVLLAMRKSSPDDPAAFNRLVGLLIAMDLEARS